MNAIRIENLTKQYREVLAVDRLSLCIEEGELFSLLGVNGAGKTTTIKMLSCLAEPTDGDAYLLGKSIRKDTAEVKKLISVSPLSFCSPPSLEVSEQATKHITNTTNARANINFLFIPFISRFSNQ